VSLKASLGELILAWDGAQTGTTIVSGGSLIPSLDDQVQQVSSPVAGALYTLDIGGNDIFNAVFAFNMACLPKVRATPHKALRGRAAFQPWTCGGARAGRQRALIATHDAALAPSPIAFAQSVVGIGAGPSTTKHSDQIVDADRRDAEQTRIGLAELKNHEDRAGDCK
jgi:hypothetical protein